MVFAESFSVLLHFLRNMNQNLLIADGGSSKTDWRLRTADGHTQTLLTAGLNPWFNSPAELLQALNTELLPNLDAAPGRIFFYGAGCGSREKAKTVRNALQSAFPEAEVRVETDLLGAARALCQGKPGIACILGTGSHACLTDGHQVEQAAESLGFWLGDEAGGAYLGKTLLQHFFYNEMPEHIRQKFADSYELHREHVLERLYKQPQPNRYAASFAPFLSANIREEYCRSLVKQALVLFLRRSVLPLPGAGELPLHFCGSVAAAFEGVLQETVDEAGLTLGHVVRAPAAGLLGYHTSIIL